MTPWVVAHQAPLSRGFPGKNIAVGCHFLQQGSFPTKESNPIAPTTNSALQEGSLLLRHQGNPGEGGLRKLRLNVSASQYITHDEG